MLDQAGERSQLGAERVGDLAGERDQGRSDGIAGPQGRARADRGRRAAAGRGGGGARRAGPGRAASTSSGRGTAGWCRPAAGASGSRAGPGRVDARTRAATATATTGAVTGTTRVGRRRRPEHGERGAGGRAGRSGPARSRTRGPSRSAGRPPRRRRRSIALPSPVRATCTTRSSDELSWSRTAAIGRSRPAESTITSRRRRASSGELAWHVDSEPSWPVFIAHNMSTASGPRTSPTMIRSGRMRRALRTSWRIVVAPSAVGGGRPRLEAHDVGRGQAELGGVLDRDDPLAVGQERAERVRARWSCRRPVPPLTITLDRARDAPREELVDPGRAERAEGDAARSEPADRDARAVDGERRHHHVHPRPVGEAGVGDRRRAVGPQPEGPDDALDQEVDLGGCQVDRPAVELARALDPHRALAVHHHLGDGVVGEQRLERPEPRDPGRHGAGHGHGVGVREQRVGASHLVEHLRQVGAPLRMVGEQRGVDVLDQPARRGGAAGVRPHGPGRGRGREAGGW